MLCSTQQQMITNKNSNSKHFYRTNNSEKDQSKLNEDYHNDLLQGFNEKEIYEFEYSQNTNDFLIAYLNENENREIINNLKNENTEFQYMKDKIKFENIRKFKYMYITINNNGFVNIFKFDFIFHILKFCIFIF